jgi:hypothetical protein
MCLLSHRLYRQDMDKFVDFTNVWHAFASMFSYLLAMFDYNVSELMLLSAFADMMTGLTAPWLQTS